MRKPNERVLGDLAELASDLSAAHSYGSEGFDASEPDVPGGVGSSFGSKQSVDLYVLVIKTLIREEKSVGRVGLEPTTTRL